MATTMQQAQEAKALLRVDLKTEGIEASCGVTRKGDDFAIKVNVRSAESAASIPARFKGVPVVVAVTGPVRALAARKSK